MDDEDFFDDDLELPDNTLQELERNAIASTQQAKASHAVSRPPPRGLNTVPAASRSGSVNKNLPWRPPQPQSRPLAVQAAPTNPPASAPAPPSSDYGFDDEDVIDLDEPSMVIRPASGPQTTRNGQLRPSAAATAWYGSKSALDPETEAAFAAADAELAGQWSYAPHLAPKAPNSVDTSALQARVAELEAEQARLRQAEQEARSLAATKQGEIAIVRANQEKATKEYERRIAVMQKLHADEAAKVKAELEAGRKEREKMETDNRFLQHDLAQEADRVKRLNGPGKARAGPLVNGKGKETPRKAKKNGLGDGFEDEEVQVVSPSKSKEKSKDSTPKHGTKRKRTANDSPVAALSFTQEQPEPVRRESTEQSFTSVAAEQPAASVVVKEDDRYEFMQRLLNHRPYVGHERTIEAMSRHHFPSDSAKSLSTLLLDILSRPANRQGEESDHLPIKLSRACLTLWSRCLMENHFVPLYLLHDLIDFALYSQRANIISQLVEEALPLCVRSIDLVAAPIFRASTNPTFAASLDKEAQEKLAEEIGVDDIMNLLLRLAQAATLCGDRIEVFWRNMDFQCVMLMLNKAQPLSQITTCLRLVKTSSLPTTFGPITPNDLEDPAHQQTRQENALIDRLTILLFEIPEAPKDHPVYSVEETTNLRLEVLSVIKELCQEDHGGVLLAGHRSAIGRLIRFLNVQINLLYRHPPEYEDLFPKDKSDEEVDKDDGQGSLAGLLAAINLDKTPEPSAHTLISRTINQALRLVYHLLRTHESTIDLTQKFSVIQGGYHKFLISMTRLAFSEQLVLEHGIEDAVVEAAHEILDNFLSPEEGEAVHQAVETPRGTRGSGGGVVVGNEGRGDGDEDGDTRMDENG